MSDIELNECPFCGGEAFIQTLGGYKEPKNLDDPKPYDLFIISCNCKAYRNCFPTKDVAVKAWNTRPENNLQSQLQIAREALERIATRKDCLIDLKMMRIAQQALSKITSMSKQEQEKGQ